MPSSHPPTLLKIAARTVTDDELFARGDLVLIAVSGGPDSIALLHVLAKLAPARGIDLVAHGVDHGLRSEAPAELALAAKVAEELGVPFASTRVDVGAGANLMARARKARYAALDAALQAERSRRGGGAGYIATGHHADDRAETVLMRLLRGTGPVGLAVLPPRAPPLIRPFVRARRTDVRAHIERHRLPYVEDPTNRDPRFLRTRVRGELLPLMAQISPRIVENLCALADAAESPPPGVAPIPAIFEGHRLGRAQRAALSRALATGNSGARVPIGGGKIVAVDLSSRTIVFIKGG